MGHHYAANVPEVISEPMDGELVAINLASGCYYSLNNTAALLWKELEEGFSVQQAARSAARQCGREEARVLEDFLLCVERFVDEGLMLAIEREPRDDREAEDGTGPAYRKPDFEKFSDMRDMLLLDPIHEVSDAGWPNKKNTRS